MTDQPPWLVVLAWIALASGAVRAGWVFWDIVVHGRHQVRVQIGMCLGFATARPVNVWLIRRGIKEAM